MPPLSTLFAPVVIAAGLAGSWAGAWLQPPGQSLAKSGPVHPVAALAWAQINCDSMLTVRDGTPRVQAEDLMRVASMFDSVRARDGDAAACRDAVKTAALAAQTEAANNSVLSIAVSFAITK